MTAAALAIGTELTRGELVNGNATWLAEALTALGFEVTELACVDDDRERIQSTLKRLGREQRVLVCTGGLGPTTDDITAECVAAVLGVPLERHAGSLELIRERFLRFGRTMTDSNAKQADFPQGARILPNPNGTAPGFAATIGQARAYFMPGVPHEMQAMFAAHVAPDIEPLARDRHHQVRLRTYGKPESEVNDLLAGVEEAFGVTLGYRAMSPEIEVKILARAASAGDAELVARRAAGEVRARLGKIVFAEGDVNLPRTLGDELVARGLRLGVAESCTGGLISEILTAIPGASRFFCGGVVSYADATKTHFLGVAPELLARHGAVSAEVARAMAEGALREFSADITLAVTGIAGPDGGSPEKPVGLVHFAVSTPAGTSSRHRTFPGRREQIRRFAAFAGLDLVRRIVLEGHT